MLFDSMVTSTPVSILFRGSFERVSRGDRELLFFTIGERYFQQQPARLAIQKWRSYGRHLIAGLDHVRSPTGPLQHVNAGAFQRVMFDRTICVSNLDVQICVRVTPLPLGYCTFEIQRPRMVVYREGMVGHRCARYCQDHQAQPCPRCSLAKSHPFFSPMFRYDKPGRDPNQWFCTVASGQIADPANFRLPEARYWCETKRRPGGSHELQARNTV